MSFEAIRGQEAAVSVLRSALVHDRVGSGYLFFGPDGVGKAMTARAFAGGILCPEGSRLGAACGRCPSCVRWAAGSHPGLHVVGVRPEKTLISIGQIQDLSEQLSLRPMEGARSVAVIDPVEKTTGEGLNALLKTLEEPAPGATLVLVTSARESLPDTILSRCQAVRFRPLRGELVREILAREEEIDSGEAELLARLSGGSPGRARRLREMGIAPALTPLLAGEVGPVELALAGNAREKRERAAAWLHARLVGLTDLLRRDPASVDRLEPAIREAVTALERLRLNVTPENLLLAIRAGAEGPNSAGRDSAARDKV